MLNIRAIMTTGWRAVAALLLLVVTAHAAAPFGQPLERRAGSAFSAATVDVSLKNAPRSAVAKQVAPSPAPLPLRGMIPAQRPVVIPIVAAPHPSSFDARGPPLAETTFSPLIARAPPAA